MRQILVNLIGNAVKFTETGFIKTSFKHEYISSSNINITITIEDSGIGIAPDHLDIIFENFQQQEEQDTRKYGGTGLGLAITKRLVEMMNGNISVKSQQGKGSIFTIVFENVKISKQKSLSLENDLPIIIMGDANGNLTYFSKGYKIGVGEQLVKNLK